MLTRPARSSRLRSWVPLTAVAACGLLLRPTAARAQDSTAAAPANHTVRRGDTLWDLAKLYLGDSFLWPEIYRLNTDVIEDPHWIYPGELLKLPGQARVVAVVPPPARTPDRPAVVASTALPPSMPDTTPPSLAPLPSLVPAASSVRASEYIAAPWADQRGGPRGAGHIIQSMDLPGIAEHDNPPLKLFDRVAIDPPVGAVAPERERYLSYRLGPLIEGFGQIVIPTGIIEITRSARNGEAAVGRVLRMFGEIQQGQQLIALDSAGAVDRGHALTVANGRAGRVRWIYRQPVLPTIQDYVVTDLSRTDVAPGDEIDLVMPRQRPADNERLAIPETFIARAQVLRVTAYGATAIITRQDQPHIEEGTAARVTARIP